MRARVLFFAPFGAWRVHTQVDAVLATALQMRGAEVKVAGCDSLFPACDVLAWSGARVKADCAACAKSGVDFFGEFDLRLTQLRDGLRPEDFAEAERFAAGTQPEGCATAEWRGLPMGRWVTSSVYTYFRTTAASLAQPHVRAVHRGFLATGVLTWLALDRLTEDFAPSHACIFNARMAPFRVAFEWARRRHLPTLVHERGACDDTFIIFENEDCLSTRPLKEAAARWQEVPLTREQCAVVKSYLAQREHGKGMNFPSFYSYRTQYASVRRALRIPEEAKVLLVLTSSEFELAGSEHFRSLAGQMELLDQLIEVFRGRQEFLVVRHHPHIGGMREVGADYEFIGRAYRQAARAPANVRFVMPAESLTSYALFWNADACISFFSSAGLEGAGRGLAAAAFAESHYHQGVTHTLEQATPESLNRLATDLFSRTQRFGAAELRRVYRFLHTFIARVPRRFKAFGIKNHFEADLRFHSLGELKPGVDPELDRVCDHILKGTPLMSLPSAEDEARHPEAEDAFLREELEEIRRQRERIRAASRRRAAWSLTPRAAILRLRTAAGQDELFGGSRRQRHIATREYAWTAEPTAGADWREPLRAINSLLEEAAEPYALVADDRVLHDESLLAFGLDQLLQDVDCALKGMLFGAFLIDDRGNFTGEIFTQRSPVERFDTQAELAPIIEHPELLLALGVFRRSALTDLARESSAAADAPAAARWLFAALQTPAFRWVPAPLAALSSFTP